MGTCLMLFAIEFSKTASEQLEYWKIHNLRIKKKIDKLLLEISTTPFSGTGKPENLKYILSGLWSRRITGKHRLVYFVVDKKVTIVSCEGHYDF